MEAPAAKKRTIAPTEATSTKCLIPENGLPPIVVPIGNKGGEISSEGFLFSARHVVFHVGVPTAKRKTAEHNLNVTGPNFYEKSKLVQVMA